MPTPKPDENRSDFVSRCIPIVLDDGTAKDQKQAVAVCNSMFEEKAMTEEKELVENKEQQEEKMMHYYVPDNIVTFADLDAYVTAQETAEEMQDTTRSFVQLASNIMTSEVVEDKAAALQSLADEFSTRLNETKETEEKAVWSTAFVNNLPDSSFLYIQSGGEKDEEGKTKPRSLRHFPYKDASGKVDLPHLRNAIARIPQSNAPGLNKTALQARARKLLEDAQKELDEETWINKAVSKFKELVGIKEKPEEPVNSFYIWKETDGRYHWLATYSNNIKDNDNPPDIIASKSHRRFVEMVDKGLAPLPELWLWHVKEWKWGEATAVAYDDNGFAVATGLVDDNKEAEAIAEWIKERDDILTSHGMPRQTVKREQDEKGNNVIVEHITREISPLFNFAAANKYTGFSIIKENNMAIPQHKREEFVKNGLAADVLDKLEAQNAVTDKETTEEGLEKKEEQQQQEAPQEEPTQEAVQPEPVTQEAVAQAIASVVKPLVEQVAQLTEQVKELSKSDAKKIAEKAAATPRASLEAMTWDSIFGKETMVDGRSSLAKSKPAEVDAGTAPDEDWFLRPWITGGNNA